MKRLALSVMMAVALFAMALAGCSASSQSIDEDTLKGVWGLDNASVMGFDAAIQFEDEDSYATYIVGDAYVDGTWAIEEGKAKIIAEGEEEGETIQIDLSYSGGKLIVGSSDGSKLVFQKSDKDDIWSYFGYDDDADEGEDGLTLDGDAAADGDDVTMEEVDEDETVEEVISDIEPVSIADEAGYAISVTGKGTDYTADPGYRLSITNKGDKAIYVTVDDDFTVGGTAIFPGLGESIEPGQTVDAFLYFDKSELENGLDSLTDVTGQIVVYDDDTDDEIATAAFHMD